MTCIDTACTISTVISGIIIIENVTMTIIIIISIPATAVILTVAFITSDIILSYYC